MIEGGGGRGLPTMEEPTFRGSVLDLVKIGVGRQDTGESGAEPLRMFLRGGATGALITPGSPFGGNAGGLTGTSPIAFLP